jgi:hypothetical protein
MSPDLRLNPGQATPVVIYPQLPNNGPILQTRSQSQKGFEIQCLAICLILFILLIFVELGFELRALHLQIRHWTT